MKQHVALRDSLNNYSLSSINNCFTQMEQEHLRLVQTVTQPQINLANPFDNDTILQDYLQSSLTSKQLSHIRNKLHTFGELCIGELHRWAIEAERVKPDLVKQNVYGEQVNEVRVGEGWKMQKHYAAKEGIVASAYESDEVLGDKQRFVQLIVASMYNPSAGLYGCPLAMTDGAAYVLLNWLKNPTTRDSETLQFAKEAFSRLTTRDPERFWTSGQWMTEKLGGSDVSTATQTIAVHIRDNVYKLYGYKWFSSATDSDVAITLARIATPEKKTGHLSLFILRVRGEGGRLNNITIVTLKDKLGTRQLPTGELLLEGAEAYLISQEGRGISGISHMLNVTRMYNASSSIGGLRKMYQIVLDYSHKRKAFGKYLFELPAHQTLLTQFALHLRANELFYLKMSMLFSKIQAGTATNDEEGLFRIMVPLLKLYTAKASMHWMSEGIEALGALGYMENSNVPVMLRDAQVLTIWEGTTNILSLDFVRALASKEKDPMTMINIYARYHTNIMMDLICADTKIMDRRLSFTHSLAKHTNNHNTLITSLSRIVNKQLSPAVFERRIREIATMFAENFIALQMLDMVIKNGRMTDIMAYELWAERMETFNIESTISQVMKCIHEYQSKTFQLFVGQDIRSLQSSSNRPKL